MRAWRLNSTIPSVSLQILIRLMIFWRTLWHHTIRSWVILTHPPLEKSSPPPPIRQCQNAGAFFYKGLPFRKNSRCINMSIYQAFFPKKHDFCDKDYWSSTCLGPTVTVSLVLSPSSSSPLIIIITINHHHIHVFWGRPGIEVHSCRRAEPLLKDILSSQKLSQIYLFKSDFEIKW